MRRSSLPALAAASFLGALVGLAPSTAHATYLSACGNIDIDLTGSETCQFETAGGCTTACTPVSVQASCAAQGEVSCGGTCKASVNVMCTSSCQASCSTKCTANQGSFSCSGSCEDDCSGHCSAQCSSDANQSECTASCQQTCGAHCNAQCSGTGPSVSCDTQCQDSCQGSCTAQANFGCDIMCQENLSVMCTSNVQGGCNTQCSSLTGSLFCNGQYVDLDGVDLQACEAQLTSLLNVNVSASAACSGGSCSGAASASCGQIAPGATPPVGESLFAIGLGVGVFGAFRRRTRKSKSA